MKKQEILKKMFERKRPEENRLKINRERSGFN
jgi:hypothetical protein